MTVPLVILAGACRSSGGWGRNCRKDGSGDRAFGRFLAPRHRPLRARASTAPASRRRSCLVATLLAAGGRDASRTSSTSACRVLPYLLAWRLKARSTSLLVGKYWIDELYGRGRRAAVRRPISNLLWRIVDQMMIDGAVNGVATHRPREWPALALRTGNGNVPALRARLPRRGDRPSCRTTLVR